MRPPDSPDSERLRVDTRKTPLQRGKARRPGKAWCSPGRHEHATHEPLIPRAMLAEVPLAGLSSAEFLRHRGSRIEYLQTKIMKNNHIHPSAKSLALGLVAAAALAAGNPAQAALVFTLQETGSGVTLVGSGSFNFVGTLFPTSGPFGSFLTPGEFAAIAEVGPRIPGDGPTVTHLRANAAILPGGPVSFGSLTLSPTATSSSGDTFGFGAAGRDVLLPLGYVSGTALSGQTFWSGETLASLGATPGTYNWNTDYGGVADTITLTITVPEPSTFALLGLAGLSLLRRRRKNSPAIGTFSRIARLMSGP